MMRLGSYNMLLQFTTYEIFLDLEHAVIDPCSFSSFCQVLTMKTSCFVDSLLCRLFIVACHVLWINNRPRWFCVDADIKKPVTVS